MSTTIELDSATVDNIIVEELLYSRTSLLQDYESGVARVFSTDTDEDRKQIAEMIKAIEKVVDWYSVPGTYEFHELPEVEPVNDARDLGN